MIFKAHSVPWDNWSNWTTPFYARHSTPYIHTHTYTHMHLPNTHTHYMQYANSLSGSHTSGSHYEWSELRTHRRKAFHHSKWCGHLKSHLDHCCFMTKGLECLNVHPSKCQVPNHSLLDWWEEDGKKGKKKKRWKLPESGLNSVGTWAKMLYQYTHTHTHTHNTHTKNAHTILCINFTPTHMHTQINSHTLVVFPLRKSK